MIISNIKSFNPLIFIIFQNIHYLKLLQFNLHLDFIDKIN